MKRFFSVIAVIGMSLSAPSFADTSPTHIKRVGGKIRALDTLSIHTYKLSKNDVESINDNDGKLTDYFARKIAKRYEANPEDSTNIVLGYHYINPKKLYPGVLTFSKPPVTIQRTKTIHSQDVTEMFDARGNKVPIAAQNHDCHAIYEYKISLRSDPESDVEDVSLTLTQGLFSKDSEITRNTEIQSGVAKPTIRRDNDLITEKNTTTWFYFKYDKVPVLVGVTPEIVLNKDDVNDNKTVLDEQYKLHHKASWFGSIMNAIF